jgi:hypothetical protein
VTSFWFFPHLDCYLLHICICLSVCISSIHMEKFGSHWIDFRKILYLKVLRKSAEEIPLKSDKNSVRVLYIKTYEP